MNSNRAYRIGGVQEAEPVRQRTFQGRIEKGFVNFTHIQVTFNNVYETGFRVKSICWYTEVNGNGREPYNEVKSRSDGTG